MAAMEEKVKRVVMAEDDSDDFQIVAEAIRDLSLEVLLTRAENGDVLMKMLNKELPDVLLLDMIMPLKNGKDCLLEIRQNKKFDNLPIIVYSGLRDFETIEFCFRKGTNMYVYKPHTYSELVEVMEKIFAMNWKQMKYYPKRSDFVLNP